MKSRYIRNFSIQPPIDIKKVKNEKLDHVNPNVSEEKRIDFKSLPRNLRHGFLGENSTFLVIIDANLDERQTTMLLNELR